MKFSKLHGLGNDYVCINCFEEAVKEPDKTARLLCKRHFGIGADGLILIKPSKKADFCMEMYNPDGSRGAMCGNGIRCLAKYVYDCGMTNWRRDILAETDSGIKKLYINTDGRRVIDVTVDMGAPMILIGSVTEPLLSYIKSTSGNTAYRNYRGSNAGMPFSCKDKISYEHENVICVNDRDIKVVNISMGNPHAVVFCEDFSKLNVRKLGGLIEKNEMYPERTNVEFVRVIDSRTIDIKVWERGAGETLACGTGACAALAAAYACGYTLNSVKAILPGGELLLSFNTANGHMMMRGPVCEVFKGEVDLCSLCL